MLLVNQVRYVARAEIYISNTFLLFYEFIHLANTSACLVILKVKLRSVEILSKQYF